MIDIEKIAKIARLQLTEEEKEKFSKEIDKVLEAFSAIDNIDTSNVEPSFYPINVEYTPREDIPEKQEFDPFENVIKENIEERKEGKYLKGPKLI